MLYLFKKKGDKHSAINYRPVSLTAICCKLLEHIITSNIRNILAKIKYYMIANTFLESARHNWSLAFKILLSHLQMVIRLIYCNPTRFFKSL